MPGCGKSTIGRQLARRLGWEFLDVDHEIEREAGTTIAALFSEHGEAHFRSLEHDVLAGLVQRTGVVLATGGGAVLRADNRELLTKQTTTVYLRSTPEDLARRLLKDTRRPLLQGGNPLQKLRDLHAIRQPLYQSIAQFTVDTGRQSMVTVVNRVLMQLELGGAIDAWHVPATVDGTCP